MTVIIIVSVLVVLGLSNYLSYRYGKFQGAIQTLDMFSEALDTAIEEAEEIEKRRNDVQNIHPESEQLPDC
jgi:hypothetical protein